jgi:hypothetical protein
MTLISTACSWVSILGGQKAAIIAQVDQFYPDAVDQYYSAANKSPSVQASFKIWARHRSRQTER